VLIVKRGDTHSTVTAGVIDHHYSKPFSAIFDNN